MIRLIFLFLIIIIFSSCAAVDKNREVLAGEDIKVPVRGDIKVFDAEDTFILYALRSESLKNYDLASEFFMHLYKKSDKKEYLYRALVNDLLAKKAKEVIIKIDSHTDNIFDDKILTRLKMLALIDIGNLQEAEVLGLYLISKYDDISNYISLAKIKIQQKKFEDAVKYLESAYAQKHNKVIIDKISVIMYVNLGRKKEAIKKLETHLKAYPYAKSIYLRLINFYAKEKNVEEALKVYLRLYKIVQDIKISKKIAQIYLYQKEHLKLIEFLETNGGQEKILLDLYANLKMYKKAYKLSEKLYKKTKNKKYLIQSAVFEYESSDNKNDKRMLSRVVSKFDKSLDKQSSDFYYNYYGYILIDHNLDIKKGIRHIEIALKNKPNSVYFLDSLAWGYYRLKKCKKAKELMDIVLSLDDLKDKELIKHKKLIDNCK